MSGIIRDSVFQRNDRFEYEDSQQSLHFHGIQSLIIENSTFKNMISERGGAILAKDLKSVQMIECKFEFNQAFMSGGALYVEDCAEVNVTNSLFSANKACKLDDGYIEMLDYQNNQYEGGAICAQCKGQCKLAITKN